MCHGAPVVVVKTERSLCDAPQWSLAGLARVCIDVPVSGAAMAAFRQAAVVQAAASTPRAHEAPHVATLGHTYVICGHRMHESLMAFELAMSAGSTGLPANIACFIPISDVNASQSQYSQ